jgi:hypothetical protein
MYNFFHPNDPLLFYNGQNGPYKFTKVTIIITEKEKEVYNESVIIAPVSSKNLIFDARKFLNDLRCR